MAVGKFRRGGSLEDENAKRRQVGKRPLTREQYQYRERLIGECERAAETVNATTIFGLSFGGGSDPEILNINRELGALTREKLLALETPQLEQAHRRMQQNIERLNRAHERVSARKQWIDSLAASIGKVYPLMVQKLGAEKAQRWRESVSDEELKDMSERDLQELQQQLESFLARQQPRVAIWREFEDQSRR